MLKLFLNSKKLNQKGIWNEENSFNYRQYNLFPYSRFLDIKNKFNKDKEEVLCIHEYNDIIPLSIVTCNLECISSIQLDEFRYIASPFYSNLVINEYIKAENTGKDKDKLKYQRMIYKILIREYFIYETSIVLINNIKDINFIMKLCKYLGLQYIIINTYNYYKSIRLFNNSSLFYTNESNRNILRLILWNYTVRFYVQRYIKRIKAAKIIKNGLHNWLYKPVCNDNTVGILPRLLGKHFNMIMENRK